MWTSFHNGTIGYIRGWFRLRAERKAMWMITDRLSRSPDDILNDIGISRDEITCALSKRPNPSSGSGRNAAGP